MTELHEQLKVAVAVYMKENDLFENKGVKAAATRARQALQEIKKIAAARRKEIQTKKTQVE